MVRYEKYYGDKNYQSQSQSFKLWVVIRSSQPIISHLEHGVLSTRSGKQAGMLTVGDVRVSGVQCLIDDRRPLITSQISVQIGASYSTNIARS